jgi:hypothetical protein
MTVRRTWILALSVLMVGGLLGSAADGAKKKGKKSPSSFASSVAVNGAIPADAAVGPSTPLTSTITVPKKFKGKVVGDVNITRIQTTGGGVGAANDLSAKLSAPNGRTVKFFANGFGDVSLGPLTLDDDTRTSLCDSPTLDCPNPNQTLIQPFAGTANLFELGTQGTGPLSRLDGIPMRGVWTFAIWDDDDATNSTLNGWGLKITAAKPIRG